MTGDERRGEAGQADSVCLRGTHTKPGGKRAPAARHTAVQEDVLVAARKNLLTDTLIAGQTIHAIYVFYVPPRLQHLRQTKRM